ncbi:hypothetical protein [Rhizobium sp. MHM7A]|uniref:hypothetical protein n=1 Tax=Rhizobium sp. MHM7A TaxID=2583233 RepID=UPI0011058B69|nr:hypothetical protein [Rhizobium sp. MHM7A]TLX16716.1 hypothetical protein FFR93_05075 [Rhizobium sp. MHM7A]
MADFRTEILAPSDKQLECETCKFIEQGLIRWKKAGTNAVRISCRECHVYEDPLRYKGQFRMVFENEMTSVSIANMSRMVAAFVHTGLWSDEIARLVDACLQKQEIPGISGLQLDEEQRKKLAAAVVIWLDVTSDDDAEMIEEILRQKFKARTEKIGAMLSQVICDDKKIVSDDWEDIEAARQLLAPDETKIFDWSVRYIPLAFDSSRVKGWTYLKEKFFEELISIATLRARMEKALARELRDDSGGDSVDAPHSADPFASETGNLLAGLVGSVPAAFPLTDMPTDPASHREGKNEEN